MAVTSAQEMSFTTVECTGKLGATGKTPTPNHRVSVMGHPPRGPAEQPSACRKGLAIPGITAVPAFTTAPRRPGLPARASTGENKPRGRNPAPRPGSAARLLGGETKREAQLALPEAYALPNESRPRSYAGVAPIPKQASTLLRANAGARKPPRKET